MVKDFDIRRYVIPLTRYATNAPINRKTKRALVTIKRFAEKNTRVEKGKVLIGEELNKLIWCKGIKRSPSKVKVFIQNIKDGRVFVNLEGAPLWIKKEKKEEKKKDEKKEGLEELTDEFKTEKKEEKKKDEKKTEKKPAVKPKKK